MILVADIDAEAAVGALLDRPQSLGIRPLSPAAHIRRHPQRDPGCAGQAAEFLRPFIRGYAHALVIFDWEGSGREGQAADDLEQEIEAILAKNGWGERAAVVAIAPELEAWVWSDSPQVESVLGWTGRSPALRSWLVERGLADSVADKPLRPKDAMEAALREARQPKSADNFRRLAERVSFDRCRDRSFLRLCDILRGWFPPRQGAPG